MQKLKIAFAKANIYHTWHTDLKQYNEISLRGVLLESAGEQSLLLVADYAGIWPDRACYIAEQIATKTAIPANRIAFFTTQNHCIAECGFDFDMELLLKELDALVNELQQRLQPAELLYVENTTENLIFNRRLTVDNIGTFTAWFGHDQTPNGIGMGSLLKQCFADFLAGKIEQKRCLTIENGETIADNCLPEELLSPAEDQLVQAIFFRTMDGTPLGSITRAPTHPAMTNRRDRDYVASDYPYYLREQLETHWGGTTLFFTGPCGDQVGYIGEKSFKAAADYGKKLANCLLKKLDNSSWEMATGCCMHSFTVELPLRPESRLTKSQLKHLQRTSLERFNQLLEIGSTTNNSEFLSELKQLSDRHEIASRILNNDAYRQQGYSIIESPVATRQFKIPLLCIGKLLIIGLPGEPFGISSVMLRQRLSEYKVVVLDEANGYAGYIPDKQAFAGGGYEPNAAIFTENALDLLIEEIIATLQKKLKVVS